GAKEHNLKNVSVNIPKNQLVVITGVSGSGKSSLAFDTIYSEGQRRYVESLSAYARQFLDLQNKPEVESITGLSPAIAIDQKTTSKNPRSTVGTVTEIYDHLRLLFARIGVPYSPATGLPIESQSVSQMVEKIQDLPEETKIYILAPIVRGGKGVYVKELSELQKNGFTRVRIDNTIYDFDNLPTITKNQKHNIEVVIDRLVVKSDLPAGRLSDSLETGLKLSDGIIYVHVLSLPEKYKKDNTNPKLQDVQNFEQNNVFYEGQDIILSEKFACPVSGFTLTEIEPRIFSFNSPYGACKTCDGLGTELFFDPNLVVPDVNIPLIDGAIAPWSKKNSPNENSRYQSQTLQNLAKHYQFNVSHKWKDLPEDVQYMLLYGSEGEEINFSYDDGFKKTHIKKEYEGIICNMERRYIETESLWVREDLSKYQSKTKCQTCNGYRLSQESLSIKIDKKNIGEVSSMSIDELLDWIESLEKTLSPVHLKIGQRLLKEISKRLGFLKDVGLDYLTLLREAGTLSGGESQRIRLASQIGSGLSGVLYVLDEPSIGLHQCDNDRLLVTLQYLKNLGNTVIVVEHDEDTMMCADHLIDVGPGAGIRGGEIIAAGTPEEVAKDPNSITGKYLSGIYNISIPNNRRPVNKDRQIVIKGANSNNLNKINVNFPLGVFTSVTGVSGGGKSTLVIDTLYKAAIKYLSKSKVTPGMHESIHGLEFLDKIIEIDQSPIGKTPRSNPATYTGAFGPIRDWFAQLPESKIRGYKSGRFSFNVKGGRCESCQGDGMIKIEMHFLPDVYVTCDECNGKRYNNETLEIKYKNKTIADVLDMTVSQALEFFNNMPLIKDKLSALEQVGLGYIKLGQSAVTLSGGEAQRVKLSRELSKRSTGRTLYILDEPTTGLHTHDVSKLLQVLHKLVDAGNTVLVIEHNMHVIKTSDYIVDIGPGGGNKGGNLIASGTPEEVAASPKSVTGKYLAEYLDLSSNKVYAKKKIMAG
ncbi:MAG: excinuclease ABC subunit UvrA, partial [Pseudomonadota bacterium]